MTELNPPVWVQAGTSDRLISSLMVDRTTDAAGTFKGLEGGVLPPLSQGAPSTTGNDMNVTIASGSFVVPAVGTDPAGLYLCHNQGDAVITVAPASSQARYDLIVAQVEDSSVQGTSNSWSLAIVEGTESANPVDPPLQGLQLPIARVNVLPAALNGGSDRVAESQITDLRSFVTGLGGVHLVWDQVPNPPHSPGRLLYNMDEDVFSISNGTTWENFYTFDKIQQSFAALRPQQAYHDGEISVLGTSWTSTPFDEVAQATLGDPIALNAVSSPSGQFKVTVSAYGHVDTVGQAGHVSLELKRVATGTVDVLPLFGYGPSFYNTLTEAASMTVIVGAMANEPYDLSVVFTQRNGDGATQRARFWRVRVVAEPLL